MREKLVTQWRDATNRMRQIINEAAGKQLSDAKFAEYREIENECDNAAGRIANIDGQRFGPVIPQDASRTERLELREKAATYPPSEAGMRSRQSAPGLEDNGTSRGGSGSEFRSFGEQLSAIVRAGQPGQATDPRLYQVRAPSGLAEDTGAGGGFLIGTEYSYDLLQSGMQASKIAQRCRPFPIGVNRNSIDLPRVDEKSRIDGSRAGGLSLSWSGEGTKFVASKPTFGKLHLEPYKLTGLCYLTDEIVEDSTILENFVRNAFKDEYSFVVDNACLRGTGAGMPLGIIGAPGTLTINRARARTILVEDIVNMYCRLPASSLDNAAWFCNSDVLPKLLTLKLEIWDSPATQIVGGSSPLFMQAGSLEGKPYNSMLGLPVIFIEQAETLGSTSDLFVADWSKYILATRGTLRTDTSVHVRFEYGEQTLRVQYRLDGQPERNTPLTPFKGSNTTSPFVILGQVA